jgi:hypothetical protein
MIKHATTKFTDGAKSPAHLSFEMGGCDFPLAWTHGVGYPVGMSMLGVKVLSVREPTGAVYPDGMGAYSGLPILHEFHSVIGFMDDFGDFVEAMLPCWDDDVWLGWRPMKEVAQ